MRSEVSPSEAGGLSKQGPARAELRPTVDEAARQLVICNACRYCEGYCAVFPAMELRTTFGPGDVVYLANLCHDCRACLYACQYAPPHEFGVNIPKVLADLRVETYRDYSWPRVLRGLFRRNGLVTAGCVVLVVLGVLALAGPSRLVSTIQGPGAFYEVVPYAVLVTTASLISLYALGVLAAGALRFWRDTRGSPAEMIDLRALLAATRDAATLRYMDGGGYGCWYLDKKRPTTSKARRVFHSLVFYGFLLDLAATIVAAILQDIFDQLPPFPLLSLPVVLGTVGGVMLLAGVVGLLALKPRSDPEAADERMTGMDLAFLVLLGSSAATGLLLLALRTTPAMGLLLAVHLGVIAGLFITAPYGKFAHVVYRYGALVRNSIEQERAAHD
jgi:citrate/tricarballylate utilization protein